MKKIISIGLLMLISACAELDIKDEPKEALNTNFYQHWIHSYEEQNEQKIPNVFRPTGSQQFPLSRFRMEFGFDTNGQCNYKFLSPTDRHEIRNCVYTKIGNEVFLYDDQGKMLSHLNFTILSVTKNRMEMRYGVKKPVKKDKKKNG